MLRYAFIDVHNTASTTRNMLHFIVDWHKLCAYLKGRWQCDKIFFYSGIQVGDEKTAEEFATLDTDFGCIVRAKTTIAYKNPDITVSLKCPKPDCGTDIIKVIDMGYRKKSNCDVELTVDALENAGPDTELMIFTADGDFSYLIEKVIDKGSKVYIVSNANKYVDKSGYVISRFSKKLRDLIAQKPGKITMVDIGRWKEIIKKEIPTI